MADETKKTVIIDVQTNANDATQQMDGLKSAVNEVTQAGDKMTNGMLSSFKKLATNPYVAAIGVALAAIVGAFRKLRDAINNSDDAGTAFARLGAVLKAPLQLVNKLVNSLVEGVGRLANAFTDVLTKIMPEKWREQAEAEDELVVATDNLEEAEREYALNSAKRMTQIADLRDKVAQKDKYTVEERISMLSQAMEIERQDVRERKKIADEKIRIFELEHRNQISLSDDEKEAYNQLKIAKESADREMLTSQKKLNTQMQTLIGELITDAGNLSEKYGEIVTKIKEVYAENAKLTLNEALKDNADAIQLVRDNVESLYDHMSGDQYEKAKAAIEKIKNGYYTLGVEGFVSIKAGLSDLDGVIDKDMTNTLKSIEDLKTVIGGIQVSVDAVKDAEKKSLTAAEEARKKANQSTAKSTKDAKDKQIADLKELGERYENTFALMTALKMEYEEKSNAISKEISDYESKLAKATTDKEKEYYTALIDVKKQKLKELSTTYVAELKKFTPATNEFIPDFQVDETITSAGDLAKTVVENTQEAVQGLQDAIDEALEDEEKLEEKRQQMIEDRELIVESNLSMLQSFGQIAGAIAQSYQDQIDSIMSKEGELTNTEIDQIVDLTEKKRDATIAQLALNQAVAIGQAIVAATSAAAQSGIAAPFVYAATAATILAGLITSFVEASNVAQQADEQIAKLQQQKKYATGGYIEGPGTATSDSIPARLSNGEAVINARSTAMYYDLLSAINERGGGVAFPNAQSSPIIRFAQGGVATNTAQIVEAVKAAVEDIQPVVSVKEITRVQNRIKAKETL